MTANDTVVVCVKLPLVAVIVSVYDPAGVLAPVVTDIVDELLAGFGLKLALAPAGRPLTLRLTWPEKPPAGVIVQL